MDALSPPASARAGSPAARDAAGTAERRQLTDRRAGWTSLPDEAVCMIEHELATANTVVRGYLRMLLSERHGGLNSDQGHFAREALRARARGLSRALKFELIYPVDATFDETFDACVQRNGARGFLKEEGDVVTLRDEDYNLLGVGRTRRPAWELDFSQGQKNTIVVHANDAVKANQAAFLDLNDRQEVQIHAAKARVVARCCWHAGGRRRGGGCRWRGETR